MEESIIAKRRRRDHGRSRGDEYPWRRREARVVEPPAEATAGVAALPRAVPTTHFLPYYDGPSPGRRQPPTNWTSFDFDGATGPGTEEAQDVDATDTGAAKTRPRVPLRGPTCSNCATSGLTMAQDVGATAAISGGSAYVGAYLTAPAPSRRLVPQCKAAAMERSAMAQRRASAIRRDMAAPSGSTEVRGFIGRTLAGGTARSNARPVEHRVAPQRRVLVAPAAPTAPRNALVSGVKESLWTSILQWYQVKLKGNQDDVQADPVLKHLCKIIFKRVTVRLPEGTWSPGVTQPGGEKVVQMIASEEYIAHCVQTTIERREQWLWDKCLPLDTLMNDEQRKDFLTELKKEYADTPLQRKLHADDLDKKRQGGERRRWCRELQRRCGSKQLWELVSFSGCWDPSFLEGALSKAGSAAPPVAVAAAVRKRALTTAAL